MKTINHVTNHSMVDHYCAGGGHPEILLSQANVRKWQFQQLQANFCSQ
jgi:hypothetical protein